MNSYDSIPRSSCYCMLMKSYPGEKHGLPMIVIVFSGSLDSDMNFLKNIKYSAISL